MSDKEDKEKLTKAEEEEAEKKKKEEDEKMNKAESSEEKKKEDEEEEDEDWYEDEEDEEEEKEDEKKEEKSFQPGVKKGKMKKCNAGMKKSLEDGVSEGDLVGAMNRIMDMASRADEIEARLLLKELTEDVAVRDAVDVSPFIKSFVEKTVPMWEQFDKRLQSLEKSMTELAKVAEIQVKGTKKLYKSFTSNMEVLEKKSQEPTMRKSIVTEAQGAYIEPKAQVDTGKTLTKADFESYRRKLYEKMEKGFTHVAGHDIQAVLFKAGKFQFGDLNQAFPAAVTAELDKQ